MKRTLLLLISFSVLTMSTVAFAQEPQLSEGEKTPIMTDSLQTPLRASGVNPRYISYVNHAVLPALAIPVQAGVIMPLFRKGLDPTAYDVRDHYLGKLQTHYGDYTQFVPLAITLGLQVAGVEGRSRSYKEAMLAEGSSLALTMGITLFGKHLIHRRRPDGSDNLSFPSGHSAFAFAGAAILDAEYGERFPWLAGVGYGLAAVTQLQRIIQRRHWDTDVMVGGAIGLGSTYLGYMFSDYIMRGKRSLCYRPVWESEDLSRSPFSLAVEGDRFALLGNAAFSQDKNSVVYGLSFRFPIYRHWGMNLRANMIHGESSTSTELYDAYTLMTGLSYMHPFVEGRIWIEGTADLGYLSDGKISFGNHLPLYRRDAPSLTASAMIARFGLKASALTQHHHSVYMQIGYWTAPTAMRYDRANSHGLNMFSYGLGFSYLIPH